MQYRPDSIQRFSCIPQPKIFSFSSLLGAVKTLEIQMANTENHLIQMLPRQDRLNLLPICKAVALDISEILCEPGTQTRYVYFPTEGFIFDCKTYAKLL